MKIKGYIKFITLSMTMMLVMASCSKNDTVSANRKIDIRITGDFADFDTSKATVENVFRMTWEDNDVVYVLGKALGENAISCLGELIATIVPGTDKRLADLSGTILEPAQNTKLTLVYSPFISSRPVITSSTLNIDLASQNGSVNNVAFVSYAMVDYKNEQTSTYRTAFSFATSILRINLSGLNPDGKLVEATLGDIETKCTMHLLDDNLPEIEGETPGIITRSFNNVSATSKGTLAFYVAIPTISANPNRKLTISQEDDYEFECKGFATGASVCEKILNTIGTLSPTYRDLSAEECANCYIVSRKGNYKFRADVKGNSQESVISPNYASVLWESIGTKEATPLEALVSNVTLGNDNYVYFTASQRKGNALIAVSDAEGTILWSWHIWFTDAPQIETYNQNVPAMMDRNLGATSAQNDASSLGLMYQWGRKDPFMGGYDFTVKDGTTSSFPAFPVSTSGPKDLNYSIKHPTEFIGSTNSPQNWLSSNDNTLWGSEKTIYDPCPPAYRVADAGEQSAWKELSRTELSFSCGYNFVLPSGGNTWYPACGGRWPSTGNIHDVGTEGYYWSCKDGGNNKSYYLDISSTRVQQFPEGSRATGRAVRCQKIN